jgi:hypothetical protein
MQRKRWFVDQLDRFDQLIKDFVAGLPTTSPQK